MYTVAMEINYPGIGNAIREDIRTVDYTLKAERDVFFFMNRYDIATSPMLSLSERLVWLLGIIELGAGRTEPDILALVTQAREDYEETKIQLKEKNPEHPLYKARRMNWKES